MRVAANEIDLTGGSRPSLALDIPQGQSFEDWVAMGRKLSASSQVINWWIGDWWAAGSRRYGERAKAAAEQVFPLAFQSLVNMGNVSRKFEGNRRRLLPWAHHAEVACLPSRDADVLLERAESQNWSSRDLRREVMSIRTAAISERQRDVIDIRPKQELACVEFLTADEQIVELATALSRHRELTDRESGFLERALYRLKREDGRTTEAWSAEQELEVIAMLKDGKRPPEIAPLINRTVGALWRHIHKLGGIGRIIGKGSAEDLPLEGV